MSKTPDRAALLDKVERYYSDKIRRHGVTAQGVDWKDSQSHRLRHQQFLRLIDDDHHSSVADLGCGYGDLLEFLRNHGYIGVYTGYDLSEDMLTAARTIHCGDPAAHWKLSPTPTDKADYVIASGIFNVKGEVSSSIWHDYVLDTLSAMAQRAARGFAFNSLTLHSDPDKRRPDLYYADPAWFLDYFANRYSRHVAILQDYGLYEFTLLVRVS